MRRVLLAAFFVAASIGIYVAPMTSAGADVPQYYSNVVLSFDFSDNSAPASASGGNFNIIADVLPESTGGVVRMVAIAPDGSGLDNIVCGFQPVQQSQVECAFNFPVNGVWKIHAQYAVDTKTTISSDSATRLRVTN